MRQYNESIFYMYKQTENTFKKFLDVHNYANIHRKGQNRPRPIYNF